MGTQDEHKVPFLESVSLQKRKRNAMKRIKQIVKIFKKGDSVTNIQNKCIYKNNHIKQKVPNLKVQRLNRLM